MPVTLNSTITRKLLISLAVFGFGSCLYLLSAHPAKAARASVEAFTSTGSPINGLPITQIGGSPAGMGGTIGGTGYYYTSDVPDMNNVELQAPATFDPVTWRPLDFDHWEGACNGFGTRSCIFSASGVITITVRAVYVFAPAAILRVESRVNGTLTAGASITQTGGSPGSMNGTTTYTKYSRTDIVVNLNDTTAALGGGNFHDWTGCDSTSGAPPPGATTGTTCNISVTVGSSKTIAANYITPPNATLNVQSMVSGILTAGAVITRISGTAGMTGTTQYTKTFSGDIAVVLNDTTATLGGGAFVNWTGCDSTSGTQCTVSVVAGSSKTITANYSPNNLIVQSQVNGTLTAGAVITQISGSPAAMNGTTQYTKTTASAINTLVLNDTTAALGLGAFSSWSGCDSTSGTQCTISVTDGATKTITANYLYATLLVRSKVNGTLTAGAVITQTSGTPPPPAMGGTTPYGPTYAGKIDTVVLNDTTLILGGGNFANWTGCTSTIGTTCTISVSAGSTSTVTANYTLTTTLNVESRLAGVLTAGAVITQTSGTPLPPAMGGTTVAPGQYTKTSAAAMTNVNLVAPASLGIGGFSSWTGCNSTSGIPPVGATTGTTCVVSVAIGGTKTISANYSLPDLSIDSGFGFSTATGNPPSIGTAITFHASHLITGPSGVSGNVRTKPAVRVDYNGSFGYDVTLGMDPLTLPLGTVIAAPTNNSASGTTYGAFSSNTWTPTANGPVYYQICADDPNGDDALLGLSYSGAAGGAQAESDNSESNNCTPRTAFTVADQPWIQTEDGNVGSKSGITLTSPNASLFNGDYLAIARIAPNTFRSFKSWLIEADITFSLPSGDPNNYEDLLTKFGQSAISATVGPGNNLSLGPGVYKYTGGFQVDSTTAIGSCTTVNRQSVILFIDNPGGTFTINTFNFDLTCPTIIIASGNIVVTSSVGTINAFIIADGSFTTNTGGVDNQLTINGGVVACLRTCNLGIKINLNRSRGALNPTEPSEKFIFQPSYFWLLNPGLGIAPVHYQESPP